MGHELEQTRIVTHCFAFITSSAYGYLGALADDVVAPASVVAPVFESELQPHRR